MAKKEDEMLFGLKKDELSELAFEGGFAPVADAKHYVLQPTSADLPEAFGNNVPKERFQEQVLKSSDEAKSGAVDSHPVENQPPMGVSSNE